MARRLPLLALLAGLSLGCPSPISITFQVNWQTPDGRQLPMAYMPVWLQSQDGGQAIALVTNGSGQATASFNDNPGKVTVIVEPTTTQLRFFSTCPPTNVSNYQTQVGPFSQAPSGVFPVNMGTYAEAAAWSTLSQAIARLTLANYTMPRTDVCFSNTGEGNAWLPGAGYLRLNARDAAFVDIVNHEFGHAVMQAASQQKVTTQNCNPHGMKRPTNASCAWVEGWANFFAIFARYAPGAANPVIFNGDSMEAYSSTVVGKDGWSDEGRVAAALWDLYDTHDDRSDDPQYGQKPYGDANARSAIMMSWMLQSMKGADVDSASGTIRLYFDRLVQNPNVSAQAAAAGRSIMSYNWVARVVPPESEAPRMRRATKRAR